MDTSTMGGGTPSSAPPPRGRRPIGSVVSSIMDGVRNLIRQEVELAKIEITEALAEKGKGVGLMVAAAVMALFALGFIALAGSAALDLVLPRWAANLIVASVFVVITAILLMVGRKALKQPASPELTQKTLKEDAEWAKQQLRR